MLTPEAAINAYTPRGLAADEWHVVAEFTRTAVRRYRPKDARRARFLMTAVSQHARWCYAVACLPLEPAVVFHRDTIAEYIDSETSALHALATRSTRRSALIGVAEAVVPTSQRVSRLTPLWPRNPGEPYTEEDQRRLRAWAMAQSTSARRHECEVLLSLGLGAGLPAGEMLRLRVENVQQDTSGVVVHVDDKNARSIPVLPAWDAPLAKVAETLHPNDFALLPRRTSLNANAITNVLYRSKGSLKPNTRRMRNTWLLWHLAAGADLRALIATAGLQTTEVLDRLIFHLDPPVGPENLRSALRHPVPRTS